jgi:hypothetical protein
MSTHAAQAKLKDASDVLNAKWRRASEHWTDDAAKDFRERVIDPVPGRVRSAMEAMGRMGEIIASVKRDCAP